MVLVEQVEVSRNDCYANIAEVRRIPFQTWQIQHYAARLAAERRAGNWKAVSFLRSQLKCLMYAKD